ncbi:hypothetical protein [Ferrovibrio sp.]|uniref:hypothetical protein n=1 Tax=Ferrovibrio sp. TaxID=1917215 RepID=UPI003D12F844
MADINIPPDFDLPTLMNGTLHSAKVGLEGFNLKSPGPFSYDPTRDNCPRIAKGNFTEAQIRQFCENIRPPSGQAPNFAASRLLLGLEKPKDLVVIPLTARKIFMRPDVGFPVRPQIAYRDQSGAKRILILQPRESHDYTLDAYGLVASMVRYAYAKDDLEGAIVEIVDLQIPYGSTERKLRKFLSSELPLVSNEEIRERFDIIVQAYDILKAEGFVRKASPPRKFYRDDKTIEMFPDAPKF